MVISIKSLCSRSAYDCLRALEGLWWSSLSSRSSLLLKNNHPSFCQMRGTWCRESGPSGAAGLLQERCWPCISAGSTAGSCRQAGSSEKDPLGTRGSAVGSTTAEKVRAGSPGHQPMRVAKPSLVPSGTHGTTHLPLWFLVQ